MSEQLRIEGFSELMSRLDQLKKQDADKMLNKALRAGAVVFQQNEAERAPERPDLPSGTALPPGALKIDVSIKKIPGKTIYVVGPGKYTSRAAHLVELGHRLVRGGRNRLLKSGKTKGSGVVVGQVPPHPYIRPAYEAGTSPATCSDQGKPAGQHSSARQTQREGRPLMGSGASVIGSMNIVLGGDGATFSQSIERAQAQLNKLKGMTGDFSKTSRSNFDAAGQSAQRFGHSSITSVQAASGALRELNGDITNNIRAVERFITTIPGVGGALKAIYPAVGAIAVAGMFYEGIKKAQEFITEVNKIPAALQTGFREITSTAQLTNDQLKLTDDRLQNEINKLAGKPQNNLAIAIDETRIASDRLSRSLAENLKRVHDLMKENAIGIGGQLFAGKDSTAEVAGSINAFDTDLANLGYKRNAAMHAGNSGLVADYDEQIKSKRKARSDWRDGQIAKRTGSVQGGVGVGPIAYASIHGDQSANLAILEGSRDIDYQDADDEQERQRNAKLEAQKAAAVAGTEAAKKAAADKYRAMQEGLEKLKAEGPISAKHEYDYWKARADAFQKGYAQYQEIQAKISALAVEGARRVSEKIAEFNKEQKRRSVEDAIQGLGASNSLIVVRRLLDEQRERHSNSLTAMNATFEENSDRLKEMQVGFDLSSGAITRNDAAIRLATLHMSQYQAQLAKLDQEARNDAANSSLTPDELQENQDRRNEQRAKIIAASATTAQSDTEAIGDTTIIGATTNALNEFIAATRDSAAQIKNFTDSSLAAFNDQVIKSLTTRDHSNRREFSNLGAGIFRGIAGTGLSKLEGTALSALGLGGGKKPTGASGDPLHVVMEGGAGAQGGGLAALSQLLSKNNSSGSSSGFGGILSALVGGGSSGGDSGGGGDGDGSSFADTMAGVIPFFGDGGMFSANTLAVVGDKGPELVNFGQGGNVISNRNIGKALGGSSGGGDMHFNIDARGSNDPAAVAMQINRAIRQAAPHIAAASIAVQRDRQRRLPPIKR